MSIARDALITAAKSIAQDAGPGSGATGVQLLLADPGDYQVAAAQALGIFQQARPNLKVADFIVTLAGFMFPLVGAGALVPDWQDGFSYIENIWWPYMGTAQGLLAMDENSYRLRRIPTAAAAIEFLGDQPNAGSVIRVEYATQHVLHNTIDANSTIRQIDVEALKTLTASVILQMTANKWLQNTGNTGLPNDVVDRRTQSDMARSRAKELREFYNSMVGIGEKDSLTAASGFKDLDITPASGFDYMWHPSRRR